MACSVHGGGSPRRWERNFSMSNQILDCVFLRDCIKMAFVPSFGAQLRRKIPYG